MVQLGASTCGERSADGEESRGAEGAAVGQKRGEHCVAAAGVCAKHGLFGRAAAWKTDPGVVAERRTGAAIWQSDSLGTRPRSEGQKDPALPSARCGLVRGR